MSDLTESQQAALSELQQITAAEDPDRELAVLRSVNWNVEKAAQALFDDDSTTSQPTAGPSRPTSHTVEQMSIDETSQGDSSSNPLSRRAPRRGVAPAYPSGGRPRGSAPAAWNAVSIVSFPFTLLGGLLQFVFRLLRFPLSSILPYFLRGGPSTLRPGSGAGAGGGLGIWGGRNGITEDPATVAERFVHELEDETGALTVSHAATAHAGETAGSSSAGKATENAKVLPDFFIGSYEQALKAAESELKVLCAIVLSSEHDDVPEFRRTVLTDPDLVRVLTDNDFIVWAGDIRQRDAYQASHKLGSTTYPFVAFASLHPVANHLGGGRSSGSGPRLTVLSRHEGSPSTKTSASTLVTHITTSLLPRVTPLLSRLRTERWQRAQERALREEQDRAFAEAARRDKERVLKKQAEERALQEAERKREEERAAREAKKHSIAAWRRYARRSLITPEPSVQGVRIGVRLPDGKRVIRSFAREDNTESVYAFVETLFIPAGDDPADDPSAPPPGYGEHEWSFGIVTSFPRTEIPASKDISLGSIPELKGGANLVLEMRSASSGDLEADSDSEESETDE